MAVERIYDIGNRWVVGSVIDTGQKLTADNQTSFSATAPAFIIVNADTGTANTPGPPVQTGIKRIILDNLWLKVTVAGVGLTGLEAAIIIDGINRYTSGGTDVTTNAVNTDMINTSSTIAKVYAGGSSLLASAASTPRVTSQVVLRGSVPVALDQYIIDFGSLVFGADSDAVGGTNIVAHAHKVPRVRLDPGHSALIYLWAASGTMTTAPSFEYRLTWLEV